jgi:hypothetical protein
VVELYLHRGAFEPALADEDTEQDPDRWCCHSAWGELAWQVVSQWVWNLRLELGHHLEPLPKQITEFAPAIPEQKEQAATHPASSAPAAGYGPPTTATRLGKRGAEPSPTFLSSLMGPCDARLGSLFIPMSGVEKPMAVCAWCTRKAAAGAVPARYASSVNAMGVRRQNRALVSVLLHPLRVGSAPLLWRYSRRRVHRRACLQLVQQQRIEVSLSPPATTSPDKADVILSRAQRAHFRLSWAERLVSPARAPTANQVTIRLFGVPAAFATSLGKAPV